MKVKEFPSVEITEECSKRDILSKELLRLKSFQAESLIKLQQAKVHYEAEIAKTIEDLAQIIHDEVLRLSTDLEAGLAELSDPTPSPALQSQALLRLENLPESQELLSLSMELKQIDISTYIRQSLVLSLQYSVFKAEPLRLYKFFGGANCVSPFNVSREVCEKQSSVSQKFLHNSCWCLTPAGDLIVTGGSLTGHSRSNALSYNPQTGAVQDLEPMNIARRSHASVCHQDHCYVFGGILEEERISLCERYDFSSKSWSSLPQMKERRGYLGACVFRNLIVVCGGAETSSCEVFDPAEMQFRLIAIPQIDLLDVASLVTVEDSILIFHGNFNGEVSRLYPLTTQVTKEASFCYGNSWSSCAPVVCGDSIYVLRADSIFKYSLSTKTSAYVLRMAKAVKRREYE